MNIPTYLNTSQLTIQRAHRGQNEGGHTQSLEAVDPEGDQVTLSKWTEDVGNTTVVPHSKLTVSYQAKDSEPTEPRSFGSDEAYKLYSGLQDAAQRIEPSEDLDSFSVSFLIADLRNKAGVGGVGGIGGGFGGFGDFGGFNEGSGGAAVIGL